jgi:hypothetical protein
VEFTVVTEFLLPESLLSIGERFGRFLKHPITTALIVTVFDRPIKGPIALSE